MFKPRESENFLARRIDEKRDNSFLNKEGEGSVSACWDNILTENGIPTNTEEKIKFFLNQMDSINLTSYKPEQRSDDKRFLENTLLLDEKLLIQNPRKYNERILERVFGYSLADVFEKAEVLVGDDERISLENKFLAHPFDAKKRQIGTVLNFSDERRPNELHPLAMATQWGHENTDKAIIEDRFRFILSGIEDYGSITELRYSSVVEKQEMPIYVPMVIVGGEISNVSSLIESSKKGDIKNAIKNPVVFNALKQIHTQISLFYEFTRKRKEAIGKTVAKNEHERVKYNFTHDNLNRAMLAYTNMKDLIDKIIESNEPLIKERCAPDVIHNAIMDICEALAKENDIVLENK